MKHLFLLSTLAIILIPSLAFSQAQQPYQQQWDNVKKAENNGKTRTAWDISKQIYTRATNDNHPQEKIKALIYQLKYRQAIEENADIKNIHEVDSLAKEATGVSEALLKNLEASLYLSYVHANKYKILNRATADTESQEDINTWSLSHLYQTINRLYTQSLADKDKLKTLQVSKYTTLIDTGKNALYLRPTLYDMLAHNALKYFTSEEYTLTRPAQHFVINDPAVFASSDKFVKHDFKTADSSSLSWTALQLYQDLITFHLKDKKPDALIDVDIHRIEYAFKKSVIPHKDSLFKHALRHLIEAYPAPTQSEAVYRLALWFYRKGSLYVAGKKEDYQWAKKSALLLAKKGSDTLMNEGNVKCNNLKHRILRPDLSVKTEQVNIPDKPFRALVSYKNEDQVWLRIVQLESKPRRIFRHPAQLKDLLEEDPVKEWNLSLPQPGDYQTHRVEIKVDQLPAGRYALIASAGSDFNSTQQPISLSKFSVSNLSYVEDQEGNFLVVDRESGKPVKKAKVRLWHAKYSSKKKRKVLTKGNKYKTDKNGYFKLGKKEKDRRFLLEVSRKKEHLFVVQNTFHPNTSQKVDKAIQKEGFLFTDRSIYRPGQKLYFKGILTENNPEKQEHQVIKGKAVTVFLYDANNQKIDSLKVTSNDFGSFAGSFDLPTSAMNGRMHLSVLHPGIYHAFSVEDYKRPTFEVQWDKKAGNDQLGDQVTVSGKIKGYNGAPENGATIQYQVSRKPFRLWYRSANTRSRIIPPFQNTNYTITQGAIKADSSGSFHIPFKAIPKQDIPKKYRIFNYEVSIDVTNLSGETHHYSYTLPIGNRSLLLSLDMPEKLALKNTDTLFVKSTDLQGHFKPTSVAISIYPLQSPHRFIRQRLWDAPDQFVMDKKDFLDAFPHDEYKQEADMDQWTKEPPVFVSNDQTQPNEKILFNPGNIRQGWYMIQVMARDKNGHFVTDSQYVQIYHAGLKHIPFFHKMLWTTKNTINGVPGDKLSWRIGSSEKAFVFEETNTLHGTQPLDRFRLNHKVKKQRYSVTEQDRGGVIRHYITVRYNRVFKKDIKINVPWKDKKLHIQYETFRNKILPGKKETWKVQITGPHHQKVNAELLASMYDQSLDQFVSHTWEGLQGLFPELHTGNSWETDQNFKTSTAKNHFSPASKTRQHPDFTRQYATFKRFGLDHHRYTFHPMARPGMLATQNLRKKAVNKSLADQMTGFGNQQKKASGARQEEASHKDTAIMPVQIRKDFRETAFFYPRLHTDADGHVSFTFTSPEALTQWKLMLQAHTSDMKVGFSSKTVTTQKPLMIQMNAPGFVRQGDTLTLSAKLSNLSNTRQSGKAVLTFENTITNQALTFVQKNKEKTFLVKPGQTTSVSWQVIIPHDYTDAITYTVKATSGDFSDGEQDILPVLSNKTKITSSLPFHFVGNGHHQIDWKPFSQSEKQTTLQPGSITLEYTANPIWYVVQALPFIDKTTEKSANALFQKVYADALSRYVALKIPHFKAITQHWIEADSNALKSPLQKNKELKNILLQETPWVQTAQSEAAQKARLAHWYKETDHQLKLKAAIQDLKKRQSKNGGFSWFKGMPDSWLITQEIITGLGHLKKLHAWPHIATNDLRHIIQQAVPYLDVNMEKRYHQLQANHQLEKNTIHPKDIQYLYMRSFFQNIPMKDSVSTGYNYFYQQAKKYWVKQSPYLKAMLALTFHEKNDDNDARKVLASLKESLIRGDHGGLHWKKNPHRYYWYQSPTATQSIGIEAFSALSVEKDTINSMRSWLLNQKQTEFWGSGSAAANATYALLLNGTDWKKSKPVVHLRMGDSTFVFGKGKWGLQYKKITIPTEEVAPTMKDIRINISGAAKDQPGWGAAYFQYFTNMNSVAKEGSELHIQRQISKETPTPDGHTLSPINAHTSLKVGDKVQIRLIVKADRDMDFVHFKDIRATCMEPLQVLSGYHFKDGIGYYSTVDDAAVHFYFRHLPKGTYVFTYPVYITQKGRFTGGLSQIESLYAPEIRGHSEGRRIEVK